MTAEADGLRRELEDLRARLDGFEERGLNFLRFKPLRDHPVRVETAVPTDTPADGTLRIVETGGVRYVYGYTTAGGWERVALA